MMKVAIMPVTTPYGRTAYHAMSGQKHAAGATAGAALDALTDQLPTDEMGTLVIVQNFHPDGFFTATQQHRLAELMTKWRDTHDHITTLSPDEQAELEALIADELDAATRRAATLAAAAHL